jgi:hypothetical protein
MNEAEILSALQISAAQRKFDPLMADAIRLQNQAAQQAVQAPDTSQLERLGYERERQGQERQLGGMMLATGLPAFQNIAAQTYRQGLEDTQPWELGEGVYSQGRYVADPFKRQSVLTKTMAAQAAAAREAGSAYGQEEDRQANRAIQSRHVDAQVMLARAQMAKIGQDIQTGKLLPFKDANDNPMFMDVRTRQVINPLQGMTGASSAPGTYPSQPSHRASEDERKTAYQTQATATRAAAIDPNYASPGFFEGAVRTLIPGAPGEVAANWLSSGPRQVTRQAQEGVVDSLLYLATGAAYNKEQLQQARNEFLPSFSDKPETSSPSDARCPAGRGRANRAGRMDAAAGEPAAGRAPELRWWRRTRPRCRTFDSDVASAGAPTCTTAAAGNRSNPSWQALTSPTRICCGN